MSNDSEIKINKLRAQVEGLHFQTSPELCHSYSLLMPIFQPEITHLTSALVSCLNQTSPSFELLVAFDGPHDDAYLKLVEGLRQSHAQGARLKIVASQGGGPQSQQGISATTNRLAQAAQNEYLVFVDHDDLLRPDLLFRYDQALSNISKGDRVALYCNENKIDENGNYLPQSTLNKPVRPAFPYLFINTICHCLAVPRADFFAAGGLRSEFDGAQDYDLCLRLDARGVAFHGIPITLYSWRAHKKSTAKKTGIKSYAAVAGTKALQFYIEQKKLGWKIEPGLFDTSYRARPAAKSLKVHVVILFKDKKELTLDCVTALKQQVACELFITAVDHESGDRSIASELEQMGVEVIRQTGGFNFSKFCNRGARQSRFSAQTDTILFLNNDVILKEGAIAEMASWIGEPQIGAVGCHLSFPSGKVQHGGVHIDLDLPTHFMPWRHIDYGVEAERGSFSRVINVVDAVTGAALMISRATFESVGGFDEWLYPIAYSDTDLCVRIRQKGLHCLFTPYARGTHFESETRGYGGIEDFEGSRWLLESKYESSLGTTRSVSPYYKYEDGGRRNWKGWLWHLFGPGGRVWR